METITKMKCPHCGLELDLDNLFAAQMGHKIEEEKKRILSEALEIKERESEQKIAEAVKTATEEQGKQIEKLLLEIGRLNEANTKANEELKKLLSKEIELKQQVKEAELDAQKKLGEQMDDIYKKAKEKADEESAAEIAALKKKVDDANEATEAVKRKLEQGSQQLQGEVQELRLEDCLRAEFPLDRIEEVEKGKPGADVIQTIVSNTGKVCGRIVWESKNVKGWKNEFIPKLRGDMERVNGDIGILVSHVFGKNMTEFTEQDGVWLVKPGNVMPMARLMRDGLLRESKAKAIAEQKETLQDAVYSFVTSPAFRNRVENIGRQYRALDEEINKTRDVMIRHWEAQRKLVDELVGNTQGILGDVDAFLLQADSEIRPAIEQPETDPDD